MRSIQLVIQYDGSEFSGWQRQSSARTVQGVLEDALAQLTQAHVTVRGAGRTDAGVHALAQAADIRVPDRWTPPELSRALNAVLPDSIRISGAFEMKASFDARRDATSRRYSYWIATEGATDSPFRRRHEWHVSWPHDVAVLERCSAEIVGDRCFRTFAVRGTAPEHDTHRCTVTAAGWRERPGGLVFMIEANRFLHHMVRFLVGTMLDFASGRRKSNESWSEVMAAEDNARAAPPAPAHALFLERVTYPRELYAEPTG